MSSTMVSADASASIVAGPSRDGARLDDDAVRALYAEHASALLRYALRMTGDQQRAEDIVQETMVRAWRNPDVVAPDRGPVRPWLFTVARHLVIDSARARKARPSEAGEPSLASSGASDDLDAVLAAQDVAVAMARLTEAHRAVLLETYFRGRSVAEAAVILAIPVGTVKSRTYYALHALRLAVEELGITR